MANDVQTIKGIIKNFSSKNGGYQLEETGDTWYNLGFQSWDKETKTGVPKPFVSVEKGQTVVIEYVEKNGKCYINEMHPHGDKVKITDGSVDINDDDSFDNAVKRVNNSVDKSKNQLNKKNIDSVQRYIVRQSTLTNAVNFSIANKIKDVESVEELAKRWEDRVLRDED